MKKIAKYPNSIKDNEPSDLKTLNPSKILRGASLKILQEDTTLGDMVGDNTSEMAADINKDDVDKSDTDVKMEFAGKVTDAVRENAIGRMNAADRMNVAAGRVTALVRKTVDV
ncbi:unnamed protein product [Prunus armeniaca]